MSGLGRVVLALLLLVSAAAAGVGYLYAATEHPVGTLIAGAVAIGSAVLFVSVGVYIDGRGARREPEDVSPIVPPARRPRPRGGAR